VFRHWNSSVRGNCTAIARSACPFNCSTSTFAPLESSLSFFALVYHRTSADKQWEIKIGRSGRDAPSRRSVHPFVNRRASRALPPAWNAASTRARNAVMSRILYLKHLLYQWYALHIASKLFANSTSSRCQNIYTRVRARSILW